MIHVGEQSSVAFSNVSSANKLIRDGALVLVAVRQFSGYEFTTRRFLNYRNFLLRQDCIGVADGSCAAVKGVNNPNEALSL